MRIKNNMQKRVFIKIYLSLCILSFIGISSTYASNWQYSGPVSTGNGNAHAFFNGDDVTYNGNVISVRVRLVTEDNLNLYYQKNKQRIIKTSSPKILRGYVPVYFELAKAKRNIPDIKVFENAVILITLYETIVNTTRVPTLNTFHYEIDCRHKRMLILNDSPFRNSAGLSTLPTQGNDDWQFMSPDSSAERLSIILCRRKLSY